MKRPGLAPLVAAAVLFAPTTAAADDNDNEGPVGALPDLTGIVVALLAEPLIPDLRVEFGDGVHGKADAVLSWPIYLAHIGVVDRRVVLSPVFEPQYVFAGSERRIVTGARLWWMPREEHGLLLDGAARFSSHADNGAVLGAGVVLLGTTRLLPTMPTVSVVYRYSVFGDERRHDVSLDLTGFALLQLLDLL